MKTADYWYKSGTPTYLAKLLEGHNVNMQKLTGQSYTSDYFSDYRAYAEDPLAMLYQSGYITIKGYDKYYKEYILDFPNDEVRKGFVTLTANSYFGKLEDRPDNDVFIFEFKLDESVEDALKQIEKKQYAVPYLSDNRSVYKIGVNISSESRTVD